VLVLSVTGDVRCRTCLFPILCLFLLQSVLDSYRMTRRDTTAAVDGVKSSFPKDKRVYVNSKGVRREAFHIHPDVRIDTSVPGRVNKRDVRELTQLFNAVTTKLRSRGYKEDFTDVAEFILGPLFDVFLDAYADAYKERCSEALTLDVIRRVIFTRLWIALLSTSATLFFQDVAKSDSKEHLFVHPDWICTETQYSTFIYVLEDLPNDGEEDPSLKI
jgi:hypothetical protein